MGRVLLEDMQFFSYHGHYPEEKIVGNKFIVNLAFDYDSAKVEQSDELEDAVNYQIAYQIIDEEMKIPSRLLEHIARRILDRIEDELAGTSNIVLKISKLNPPMGGQMRCVSVELKR